MLNQNEMRSFVDKIIKINSFNLTEYQDKYYFRKKINEIFPDIPDKDIYSAIEKIIPIYKKFNINNSINELSNELYSIYLIKGNDTSYR